MRPVSDQFGPATRGSHTMISRARVCAPGQTGTDPDGTEIPILGGDARFDATADQRGSLDLLTDGTGMWPQTGSTLLAPYGNEIYVERGIDYGNGHREWVGLGYFRITVPQQEQAPDGPIRVTGADRMIGLRRGRLLTPRQFASATARASVVTSLVAEIYPTAVIDWDAGSGTALGRDMICEEDRFGFLSEMIAALGKIWYWDYRGHLVITDPPPSTSPVFDINAGRDGVLVQASRALTSDGVYNAVVASGEATDTTPPVTAVAIDNDPGSPTYFYGSFGQVPRFYTSPFITTEGQAYSAASVELRREFGLPYTVDLSAIPHPGLEVWDPVRVLPSTSDSWSTHVLQEITIPLTYAGAMTARTREQRLVIGSA